MKIDFDSFEFAGLLAPGSVVVVALVLLWPGLIKGYDPAVLIAISIPSTYVIGHLVAALGNIFASKLRGWPVRELEEFSRKDFENSRYISSDQLTRFYDLVESKLYRQQPLWDEDQGETVAERYPKWKTAVKQMYIVVASSGRPQRLETFEGLYNLSRGLFISFLICTLLAAFGGRYAFAVSCIVAARLAVYRSRKFKDHYSKELVQQFLLLEHRDQLG